MPIMVNDANQICFVSIGTDDLKGWLKQTRFQIQQLEDSLKDEASKTKEIFGDLIKITTVEVNLFEEDKGDLSKEHIDDCNHNAKVFEEKYVTMYGSQVVADIIKHFQSVVIGQEYVEKFIMDNSQNIRGSGKIF